MPPTRLILSYVLDWIIIIAIAATGGGLNFLTPYHRPFSLLDLSISYPLIPELVSTTTLVLVSLVAPAIIILLVVAIFVPGRNVSRSTTATATNRQLLRLKLWEFERGWAGLGLSLATAFFITQGAKNLFGKPRPDLLARCQPDLTSIASHVVGGYGQDVSARWTLVASSICTNPNRAAVNDGFRSFPSGHSSFSWAGLLYLTLFLCSKFAITIPHLPVQPNAADSVPSGQQAPRTSILPLHHHHPRGESSSDTTKLSDPADLTANPTATASPTHPLSLIHI